MVEAGIYPLSNGILTSFFGRENVRRPGATAGANQAPELLAYFFLENIWLKNKANQIDEVAFLTRIFT